MLLLLLLLVQNKMGEKIISSIYSIMIMISITYTLPLFSLTMTLFVVMLSIHSLLLFTELSIMASLTKEELRNALVAHGVTDLPPLSAKKEELKALYEEHVAPIANDSAEFSSDDEVSLKSASKRASTVSRASKVSSASKLSKVSKSSSKSPKKAAEDTLVVDDLDIDALDDDELFEKLRENGVDVGPIVASTRPFYKKKLALVLKGETMNSTNGNGAEYSDTDPETEEEEAEEEQPAVEARVTRRCVKT